MDGWVGGWMDGWVGGCKSRVKDCLQQSTSMSLRKFFNKIAKNGLFFLKFKFLFIYKLNFNGGQFYKKTLNFDYL